MGADKGDVECSGKHTAYQPTEKEFKCPECGAKPEDSRGFYTDEPAEDANSACNKMHVNDGLRCYSCDYEASGQSFASKLQKKHNLVPCKHCKGKGLVPGGKK